jgi:hypothetical protein
MESGQSGDGASHGHTSTVVETAKEEALAGGYDEEEEDCTPLPNGLICSRQNWETMYGKFGAFEDESKWISLIYIYIYIYVCIYMCIYIYVCMYIFSLWLFGFASLIQNQSNFFYLHCAPPSHL